MIEAARQGEAVPVTTYNRLVVVVLETAHWIGELMSPRSRWKPRSNRTIRSAEAIAEAAARKAARKAEKK